MAWLAAQGFQNLRCPTPIRLTLAASLVTMMRAPRQPCSFTPPIHPMPKKSRYQETRATCIEYLLYPNRPHEVRPDVRQVTCAVEEQAEWIATQKAVPGTTLSPLPCFLSPLIYPKTSTVPIGDEGIESLLSQPYENGCTTGFLCSQAGSVDCDAAMPVLGTTSSPLRDTSGPNTCQRLVMTRLVKSQLRTPDVKCNNATEDKYQAMTMIIHVTVQDFRPRVLSDSRPVPHLSPGDRRESGALLSQVNYQAAAQELDDIVVLTSLPRENLLLPLMTLPLTLKYEERFFMRLLTTPQTGMTTSSQV